MALGFREVLDEDYLRYRIRSIEYLGEKLLAGGVAIVQPPGGHAIYINAADFCKHIPKSQFPGQALACLLYELGRVRACEIGSVMMGEHALMELVRLAIPRRTYRQSHIDYVIEVLLELKAKSRHLRGFRITDQPEALRHSPRSLNRRNDCPLALRSVARARQPVSNPPPKRLDTSG